MNGENFTPPPLRISHHQLNNFGTREQSKSCGYTSVCILYAYFPVHIFNIHARSTTTLRFMEIL